MTEHTDGPDGGDDEVYIPSEAEQVWAAEILNDDEWHAAHGEGPNPEDEAVELAYFDGRNHTEAYGDWLGREAERLARDLCTDGDEDGEGVGP